MKLKSIFLVSILFLLFNGTIFGQRVLKVGYVQMNKAINTSVEGIRSKKKLEKKAHDAESKLALKEQQIKIAADDLKNNIMLNQSTKDKKRKEIIALQNNLREELKKAQIEFRQEEAKETKRVFDQLAPIIKRIAKEEGFDFVLEYGVKQAILFSKHPMIDITDKVITEYNKSKAVK